MKKKVKKGRLRVLHTSDWHLGRSLHSRQRYHEYEAFLAWLEEVIVEHEVDVLLVAGDVFDTISPSNLSQRQYYSFLSRIAHTKCSHIVIIAGNHDSPTFLEAPREILKALEVHVVGSVSDVIADEVIMLNDGKQDQAIICAVPYLRDRDIRSSEAGEDASDKLQKYQDGVCDHYQKVALIAEEMRAEREIPVLGMGHLYTEGGKIREDDGVRPIFIGTAAYFDARDFPSSFDYVALGHLHTPQKVRDQEQVRYSGSALQIGFQDAEAPKSVCLIDFEGRKAEVWTLKIPVFQSLMRIEEDFTQIQNELEKLIAESSDAWLEIQYTGNEIIDDLQEKLLEIIAGSKLKILTVKSDAAIRQALSQSHRSENLQELDELEVFNRYLEDHSVPAEQIPQIQETFHEALAALYERDVFAE